jgi:predicted Kef-type K+ transport protein
MLTFDLTGYVNLIMLMVLDLLNFIFMMVAAAGPLYMAYRVRGRSRRLFALAILLVAFTVTHGAYHLLEFVGLSYLAAVLFWPLSTVLLLCFGVLYWRTGV